MVVSVGVENQDPNIPTNHAESNMEKAGEGPTW